ncbi:hypothetical protein [Thermovenabulum gondwanense]|uniref:Uncharacterized protein n=1 Tax=Thermovenabulum gondwanense TaxID=520767 RepID=A0A161PUS8_9FIRM|nr:hypothetical protein [Thermovenabulum gondwanense]KYO66525.1 hypothetical protein ATZ99_11530 [Thermovenabulum gondwanense]
MNFEELKKSLESTGLNAESISKIMAEYGITPDNMEKARELLEQLGIKEIDQKGLENVMKSFVDILPPEVKKQVKQLALEFEKFYPDMPMPEDMKKMLEKWSS